LGSSLGYGAACLLDAGLSNVAVSITDPTNRPSQWRVGGVPILALLKLRTNTETGESALKVPSQEVKLTDIPYQKFKAAEQQWRLVDHYCNPGPV
jgi:diphosphate-dependent phosphofructokinase